MSDSAKGNPASHRMSNPHRKNKFTSAWTRVDRAKKDGTHRSVRNRLANEALHAEKVENDGLGRRERRRVAAGIRKLQTV